MTGSERFQQLTRSAEVVANLKARSISGGTWAMAAGVIEFAMRIGFVALMARLLAPEYFGLISMVTAITTVAERFKDLGLSSATIQKADITHEQVSTLFWLNFATGLAATAAIAALAWPIASFYDDQRLVWITLALALSFPFSGAAIQHDALLRRQMKFARTALIQIGSSGLSIAVGIAMALYGFGYWALVGREVSRNLFNMIGCWLCFPWIPGRPSRAAGVGSLLQFGGYMSGFNLVWFLSSSVDQILIGKRFGAAPLGLYRQAYSLILAPFQQFLYPVGVVTESALSRLQNDREKFLRYYQKVVSIVGLLTMPLAVFMAVYADEIVRLTLGERWLEATPLFRILAISCFLRPVTTTLGAVMLSCGFSRRMFLLSIAESVTLVLLFFVGSRWGVQGVAWAHVAYMWLPFVIKAKISLKNTPVRTGQFLAAMTTPAITSLVMGGALLLFKQRFGFGHALPDLLAGAFVSLVVYFGLWLSMTRSRGLLLSLAGDFLAATKLDAVLGRFKRTA